MQPIIRPSSRQRTVDLLPNEQEISYDRIHGFFNRYKSWIIGFCLLVVLAAGGLIAWRYQEDQLHERAQTQLANAQSLDALQAVVRDYAGTDAALVALMSLGDIYFQQNQLDQASSAYQAVLERYPESPLAPSAGVNLAAIMETRGNLDKAIKAYQQVAAAYPHAFQAAQARFAAARLMEQTSRLREARQAFEDLAVFCPQSSWKEEASMRARKIGAQLKRATAKTVGAGTKSG